MFNCSISTIEIVESSDGVEIIDRGFHTLEELLSLEEGKGRDIPVSFGDLNNVLMIIKKLALVRALAELVFINSF